MQELSMSNHRHLWTFFLLILILAASGCTSPDNSEKKDSPLKEAVSGGVAIGISPRVIYADKGENITFSVDLVSTENIDDSITIKIDNSWTNQTLIHEIKAGATDSIPVNINVPSNAGNMSIKVSALSLNLNATSSTAGMIFIKNNR
jgi:hypothetical protein